MYYCLSEDYVLRGWDMLQTGIVKKSTGQVAFLQPSFYNKIRNARWMMFEGSPFLTDDEQAGLKQLVEQGIVYLSDTIVPLTEEQEYRLYPNRYLRGIHWAITGHCNCRCRHCYMSAPTGKIPEYSTEKCLGIIDQMKAAGVKTVSLTGGEALVRKDFLKLITRMTEAGIRITTIMSNGLLVNEELLDALDALGQKPEFNMSFDGIGCHDWLRGVEGVEKSVIRAFELCRERGFPTGAEYCVHRGNMDAFRDSVKLLGSLGCRTLKVNVLKAEGEALGIADYILSPEEEFQFYLDYLPHYFEDGEPVRLMLSVMFLKTENGEYVITGAKQPEDRDCSNYCLCGHARNIMHITPDGFIVPCIPMGSVENGRKQFPNIFETTLTDALNDSEYMKFIDTRLSTYFEHNPECSECEYRNRCSGGCRGNAAGSGDLLGKDEYTCSFFRDGWYDKTMELLNKLVPEKAK